MRTAFLLLLFLWMSPASAQREQSWHRSYRGSIGKFPVTLHLHAAGDELGGTYYYHSSQEPIGLSGHDSLAPDGKRWLLLGAGESERFTLSVEDSMLRGSWKNDRTSLPFTATLVRRAPQFTYVFTKGTVRLRPRLADSPEATYEAEALWPVGKGPLEAFLRGVIRELFGAKGPGDEEISALMLREKKSEFKEYLGYAQLPDKELLESRQTYMYASQSIIEVAHHEGNLMTLAATFYSYSGGAHGNYGSTYVTLNLAQRRRLKLADILNAEGRRQLRPLLEKAFRKQSELKPGEALTEGGLFENKLEPNDNFYVTAKAITFNYNPYEVGPYAMGAFSVRLPLSALDRWLQPGFRALIAAPQTGL